MAREIFKNLPDTSTPLTAEKLNGIFNGEEAMGSIVVEDITSKNMINFRPYTYYNIKINNNIFDITGSFALNTYVDIPETKFYKKIPSGTKLTISVRIIEGNDNYVNGWLQLGAVLHYNDGTTEAITTSFDTPEQKNEIKAYSFTAEKEVEFITATAGGNCNVGEGIKVGIQLEVGDKATNLTQFIDFTGKVCIIPNQEFETNEYVVDDSILKRVFGYQYNLTSPTILNEDVEVADLPSDFKKLRRVECMFYFGGYQVPDYGGANGMVFVNGGKLQMSISNQAYCGRPIEIIIYYVKN